MKTNHKSASCWINWVGAFLAGFTLFHLNPAFAEETWTNKRPKLIVTLVFDQFRADYLTRFENRFLAPKLENGQLGGFRYLMTHGAYYPYGQYDITQSMTGPGHATLFSGAYPYQNGIPSNFWYDREKEHSTYCTEDQGFATVGATPKSLSVGTSPRNMIGTTVGDELKNAGYPSRVVTVALKDRAAILMGGHRADLALWMDPSIHTWVSSRYYLPDGKLPAWVERLNDDVRKTLNQSRSWTPQGKSSLIADETRGPASFKHEYTTGARESYASPYGIDLTEQAAEKAIAEFHLGKNSSTDLFSVSFSSHDYAGHAYGPNSREMEEMAIADDRAVSKLLNFISKQVPIRDVVFVLTGDHGAPGNPDWLTLNRVASGRIADSALAEMIEKILNEKFGKPSKNWLGYFHDFNFYFSPQTLKKSNHTLAEVEAIAKNTLETVPGIAYVLTSTDLKSGKFPPGMHERQARKTFYPGRSGDITLIPTPYFMKDEDTVDHLTGYNYDRTVPMILSGPGIRAGIHAERAEVIDLAPTLTFLLGVIPPSLSEGRVLSEALQLEHR